MQDPQNIQAESSRLSSRSVQNSAEVSDISLLWQGAIDRYKTITGKEVNFKRATNVQQVLDTIEDKEEKFKWRRHDGSKIDKFRTLVKQALTPIQLIGDIVAHATKTVRHLVTYITVLTASLDVSGDGGHIRRYAVSYKCERHGFLNHFDF
jgi:hypothetical protein